MEEFFRTVVNLKKISRQGWIEKADIQNPESVADHTYSATVISMILGDMLGLDSHKMMQMTLLHDLAESITGDMTPEMAAKTDKHGIESKTMETVLKLLPIHLYEKYHAIWREYQTKSSAEAKMVDEIDKFEMGLQADTYVKSGAASKENLQVFLDSAKSSVNNSHLKSMLESFMK